MRRSCASSATLLLLLGQLLCHSTAVLGALVLGEPSSCAPFCSAGKSRTWSGDISTGEALRSMLEAVSYKGELIFTSIASENGRPDRWLVDQLLQLQYELKFLGMSHFVVLALQRSECEVVQSLAPDLSCVWNNGETEQMAKGVRLVWVARWRLMTRAVRLGYNVLMTDLDFMVTSNPYQHLKRPPLSNHQMLCLRESQSPQSPLLCNGGFLYVQNARPDGPVSWVLRMVVDNNAWMADDDWAYIEAQGGRKYCQTDDQAMLYDAIRSALVGRALHPTSLEGCKAEWTSKARDNQGVHAGTAISGINWLASDISRVQRHLMWPPEGWMHPSISLVEADVQATSANLTVPNLALGWPEELGGRFGPEPRGPLTAAWHALLRDDCPSCPWWNDTRPVSTEAQGQGDSQLAAILGPNWSGGGTWIRDLYIDPHIPQESLLMSPWWLVASLAYARRGAVVGFNAPVPSAPVMVHVHLWQHLPLPDHKAQLRKILGRYNWEVGQRVAQAYGFDTPYLTDAQLVTKVVALHPSIDLGRTRNASEYNAILAGLLQVALLSRRAAVLPDLPCWTAWAHSRLNDTERQEALLAGQQARCPLTAGGSSSWSPLFSGANRETFPEALPFVLDEEGAPLGAWRPQDLAATLDTEAGGGAAGAGAGGQAGAEAAGGRRRLRRLRRPLQTAAGLGDAAQQQQQAPQGWWAQQRYRMQLPYVWDGACATGLSTLLTSELSHWLASSNAGLAPGPAPHNTIFATAPGELALLPWPATDQPQQQPQQQSAQEEAQRSELDRYTAQPGWSLADVQAALPVARVVGELQRVSSEPVVYLGHPVAVLPGKEWYRRATEQHPAAGQAQQQQQEDEEEGAATSTGASVGGAGSGAASTASGVADPRELRPRRRSAQQHPHHPHLHHALSTTSAGSNSAGGPGGLVLHHGVHPHHQHLVAQQQQQLMILAGDAESVDEVHGQAASRLTEVHVRGQGVINFSALLLEINEQLANSRCRALQEDPAVSAEEATFVLDYPRSQLAVLRSHGLMAHSWQRHQQHQQQLQQQQQQAQQLQQQQQQSTLFV